MSQTLEELGSPEIWRNDRFWLAGDHVVHPDAMNNPKIQALVSGAEKAKKTYKMTEYQGMNVSLSLLDQLSPPLTPSFMLTLCHPSLVYYYAY